MSMSDFDSLDDQLLFSLVKKGNEAAFREIYQRYWRILYGIAYNRLKDKEAAEDITHDVFASLWQQREGTEIAHVKGYLAAATRYLVIEHLRKSVQQQALGGHREGLFVKPNAGIDDQIHHKLILEMMQGEIDRLPERCRVIFKLSREEHLPNAEIARQLDVSVSTVENQLNKALRKLRSSLKDSPFIALFF